jgi:type IV secretion system protein VirB3
VIGDPIFKGCTRPAMIGGVPMLPLIVVGASCFLVGMWGLLLLQSPWPVLIAGTVAVALYFTMKSVAKKDDQRFKQMFLWLILRAPNRSRQFWGATTYSPTRYKRR